MVFLRTSFFIDLQLRITSKYIWCLLFILDIIALFFSVTPITTVFQIQVHISLTEHGWILNICGVSSAKPVPHHVPELLYIISSASASKELWHHTRFAFLCTVINTSFYIEKLLVTTICTELWFYHRDIQK